MQDPLSERLEKYLRITGTALKRVSIKPGLKPGPRGQAEVFMDMARRYYDDALHFRDKGDELTAFASVCYAHGWIDAGARIGLFNVKEGSSDFVMPAQ